MTSKTLRRRLHHGDVDGKRHEHLETSGLDGLNEPLLGNYEYDDKDSEVSLFFGCLKYCWLIWLEALFYYFSLFYLIDILLHLRGLCLKTSGMMNEGRSTNTGRYYFPI